MVTVLDNHPKLKFQFKKGSSKKISYERRAYESIEGAEGVKKTAEGGNSLQRKEKSLHGRVIYPP